MTKRLDVTKLKLIVHIGKFEEKVTSNKRLHLRYCTVEASY